MDPVKDGMRDCARHPESIVGTFHGIEQGNVIQALGGTHEPRKQLHRNHGVFPLPVAFDELNFAHGYAPPRAAARIITKRLL
jgi:hypothetical protein